MVPDPFSPLSSSLQQPQTLVVSPSSDQRSVDGATLLSEDVYFDRENLLQNDNDEPLPSHHLQNLQVMTDLELGQQENTVEEEIEFFATEEEVPTREDGWELPIIEQHVEIDTISELSYDPHGHDFPMVGATPPNPLTAENIAKMHTQPGTPVTLQMDPFHEKFPDLDNVNVTAYNSEGINTVESFSTMKMKKSRCIFFVLVLIMVAAISLAIAVGVAQKRSSGRTTGASELEDVAPTIRPIFFDTPSASPTEELSGLQTKDPTIEEATMSPSFYNGTKPVVSPASFPTQAPSFAPEMDGQPSGFSKTSAPTTLPDDVVETETIAPTPNPTAEPSIKPTSTISVTNSPTPDPTRKPTVSPTSPPTSRPTFAATESPTIMEQTTEAPTEDPTETTTELSTSTSTSTTSCLTQIGTSQTCYSRGTPIEVMFTNCDPKPTDWIGLYSDPGEMNPSNLDPTRLWIYACGTRDCREEVTSNRIIFEIDWLPNGTYGIYLARGASSPPYTSIAKHTFEVSDSCIED